ncbi:MAG: hypothetical protein J6A86_05385, partial [Alistipes sp.]|nr:hypothetical protein [Alistipes sp.]
MEVISHFFRELVNKILTEFGWSSEVIGSLNRWVVLLFIILFALFVDLIIRIGLLRLMRQIVSR